MPVTLKRIVALFYPINQIFNVFGKINFQTARAGLFFIDILSSASS